MLRRVLIGSIAVGHGFGGRTLAEVVISERDLAPELKRLDEPLPSAAPISLSRERLVRNVSNSWDFFNVRSEPPNGVPASDAPESPRGLIFVDMPATRLREWLCPSLAGLPPLLRKSRSSRWTTRRDQGVPAIRTRRAASDWIIDPSLPPSPGRNDGILALYGPYGTRQVGAAHDKEASDCLLLM